MNIKELKIRGKFLINKVKDQRELRRGWWKEKNEIEKRMIETILMLNEKGITKDMYDKYV